MSAPIISVTYSRDGSVSIAKNGITIAALSDPDTLSETLRSLGVTPDDILTVQNRNGVDSKILAQHLMKPEEA